MSKHHSRASRWTEVSPTCFISACGSVSANPRGKWDATLRYKQRSANKPEFFERREIIGEYKRAREAMMAVEDHAKAMLHKPSQDIIIVADF